MIDTFLHLMIKVNNVITNKGLLFLGVVLFVYGFGEIMRYRKPSNEALVGKRTFLTLFKLGVIGFLAGISFGSIGLTSEVGLPGLYLGMLCFPSNLMFLFILKLLLGLNKN